MDTMTGKVAVVTGAASGIGAATAELLVSRGARVVVADVDGERGAALAERLGDGAVFVHTDVTEEEHIRAAVARAVEEFGGLDCMVNNAGRVGRWTFLEDTTADEWDASFAVLARSVFLGIKHSVAAMRGRGSGSIVNVSSVAGVRTGFGPHPYGAAKAAVLQLTRSAAQELAPDLIRVNTVIPGGIATRIVGHGAGMTGEALDQSVDAVRLDLAKFQPIPRAGEGTGLAETIAFLASDASSFITGQEIGVDGGLALGRRWPTPYQAQARAVAEQPGEAQ